MMTWNNFYDRVEALGQNKHKAIWLSPKLDFIPLPIQRYDEPFLPLGKSIIQATLDDAGLYIFDFPSYLATGAAGIVALERTIAYVRDKAITILHGPFTGKHYSVLADVISFRIDSLTVTLQDDMQYYLESPPYSTFWWNGEITDRGGVINQEHLVLLKDDASRLTIPIIHSNELLTDLSDTFVDTLKRNL